MTVSDSTFTKITINKSFTKDISQNLKLFPVIKIAVNHD